MTLDEYLKTPEKYIPQGMYCSHNDSVCPFWSRRPGVYPEHEDGFCYYLDKSDWDINEQSEPLVTITTNGKRRSAAEFDDVIDGVSGKKIHFATSLIWDQVKECRVNREDPDDIELVSILMTLDDESKLPQHLRKKQ